MLDWNAEDYGTGDERIDEQHRELFDAINSLIAACESGAGAERVDGLFAFLAAWTDTHFDHEEGVMRARDCPVQELNQAQHRQFRAALAELRGRHDDDGASDALLADMQRWLVDWMSGHIKGVDRRLADGA